jgi:hypothetical protein
MGGAVALLAARLHPPPFKPYVRIYRIRLTGGLLVQHARLRVANGTAQSMQALVPEPLSVPQLGSANVQVASGATPRGRRSYAVCNPCEEARQSLALIGIRGRLRGTLFTACETSRHQHAKLSRSHSPRCGSGRSQCWPSPGLQAKAGAPRVPRCDPTPLRDASRPDKPADGGCGRGAVR